MKFTIDKKVSLFILCIIFVFGFILGHYFIQNQAKALNLELDERASVLLNNLSINIEYPVLIRDQQAIARLVKGVMAQKDIVFCRIEGKEGVPLYQEGSREEGSDREFTAAIVTRKFVEAEEALILNITKDIKEEIGKVYLAVSLSGLKRKIHDTKKTIITVVIATIILASLGAYLLNRRILGTPIAHLVEAAERISKGDINYKIPIKTHDELGALANAFNRMTESLLEAQEELVRKEKLAILGQLAGSVGHELRNPLGVINNAIYFLKTIMPDADETVKEYLNIINDEVLTSERIVSDLLDFARTKTPQKSPVTVGELITQSLKKCKVPENVTVEAYIPETLPEVIVDPMQMGQVFQNLITNALQAMPEGGELRVAARSTRDEGRGVKKDEGRETRDEGVLRLSDQSGRSSSVSREQGGLPSSIEIFVTDTGEGIKPENMAMLFQPLYTTKARGIGLGLTVSKSLTEENGGRLEAASRLGKGTTFTVILPIERETT
jgi:two-component system NtrC family sensor kinase